MSIGGGWDEYFEDDDDTCQNCGGDGWCEVDDPINDDCDEFGFGECWRCGGTGVIDTPKPQYNGNAGD